MTLDGTWVYLWLDATYLKVRLGGRVVSVAAIIATGVNLLDFGLSRRSGELIQQGLAIAGR
ncbi:hypothetical protein MishRS11D_24620 [Methylomagnum ishizawai]|nr:hypothetical protein MishRS11D_24620 [Methylomagnum ishizawai]